MDTDEIFRIGDELPKGSVDAVIHLAADMRREPHTVKVVTSNCGGTQRLLEFCERMEIPVLVQLSSLPVIGHPVQHPITEEHPLNPYTVYHVTKVAEELLAAYADQYRGIRTASLRISAPVGVGMNPKTIFPVFIRKAMQGDPIPLFGKGTRRQNYIHVEDISRALCQAVLNKNAHGVYNLTGDNLLSNRELAETVVAELESSSEIIYSGQTDPADDEIWDASLEKIRRDIGYQPSVGIRQAIREYAAWLC